MVTLQLSHVEARYGRKIVYADASTPDITGGHLTALVGANAAGKSTLFRRIAGQLAGKGEVRITGADQADLRYMPQDTGMNAALTVYESVILALKQRQGSWRMEAAELTAVDLILSSLKIADLSDRPLAELSGGQRQLVSIAQTLVTRPKVVLMDEEPGGFPRRALRGRPRSFQNGISSSRSTSSGFSFSADFGRLRKSTFSAMISQP
jgi:iron complex transport system ATP-binding protein